MSPIQVDKKSLAYMKGKRSCTAGDVINYKPIPIIKQIQKSDGKKRAQKRGTGKFPKGEGVHLTCKRGTD